MGSLNNHITFFASLNSCPRVIRQIMELTNIYTDKGTLQRPVFVSDWLINQEDSSEKQFHFATLLIQPKWFNVCNRTPGTKKWCRVQKMGISVTTLVSFTLQAQDNLNTRTNADTVSEF